MGVQPADVGPAVRRQPVRAAGAAEQLQDPQQEDGQTELAGEPPQVQERQEVHVLQGEGDVEEAGGDELPQGPQEPSPLGHGAPGESLGQSHQQAFAEHVDVVGPAPVQRQVGQHGGAEGVRYGAALHPGQEAGAWTVLRQVQTGPVL